MIRSARSSLRLAIASLAVCAMAAAPVSAQFRQLIPRDVRNVTNDATAKDTGCEAGEKKSTARKVLGGIFGRTVRSKARETGVSRWVPVSTFSDQLTTEIACRLDPTEQKLAAEATLNATSSVEVIEEDEADSDEAENPEEAPLAPMRSAEVGSTASWKSSTRDDVSGTSTVVASEDADTTGLQCITVTDVIIVSGEETTANKRMCRPPGSRRYSLVA